MQYYNWNNGKNEKLKKERGISFEEVVFYIEAGNLLDVVKHPNVEKYETQKMYILDIGDYAYLVPFVEKEEEIFLKTIIPSRKATKKYLRSKE